MHTHRPAPSVTPDCALTRKWPIEPRVKSFPFSCFNAAAATAPCPDCYLLTSGDPPARICRLRSVIKGARDWTREGLGTSLNTHGTMQRARSLLPLVGMCRAAPRQFGVLAAAAPSSLGLLSERRQSREVSTSAPLAVRPNARRDQQRSLPYPSMACPCVLCGTAPWRRQLAGCRLPQ